MFLPHFLTGTLSPVARDNVGSFEAGRGRPEPTPPGAGILDGGRNPFVKPFTGSLFVPSVEFRTTVEEGRGALPATNGLLMTAAAVPLGRCILVRGPRLDGWFDSVGLPREAAFDVKREPAPEARALEGRTTVEVGVILTPAGGRCAPRTDTLPVFGWGR